MSMGLNAFWRPGACPKGGDKIHSSLSELSPKSFDLRNEPTLAVLEDDLLALGVSSFFSLGGV